MKKCLGFIILIIQFVTFNYSPSFAQETLGVTEVGGIPGGNQSQAIWSEGNYLYLNDSFQFKVYDITNSNSPTEVGNLDLFEAPEQMVFANGYAYLATHRNIWIVNVTDPYNPILEFTIDHDYGISIDGLALSGDYLYLLSTWRLTVFNVSDKTAPEEAGFIEMHESNMVAMALADNYLYVKDIGWWDGSTAHNRGLRAFDITNPNPVPAGFWPFSELNYNSREMDYFADYLYISDYDGVEIIDITNRTSPVYSTTYTIPNNWHITDVIVVNDTAYVSYHSTLDVVDVIDHANPSFISSIPVDGSDVKMAYNGDNIFRSKGGGVDIINLDIPTLPFVENTIPTSDLFYQIEIIGDTLYAANSNSGMKIFDVVDPVSPTLLGQYNSPEHIEEVFVYNNHAFLGGGGKMSIVDVTNPSSPAFVSDYLGNYDQNTLNYNHHAFRDIVVDGNYLYAAISPAYNGYKYISGRIEILDITDYANPVLIGQYDLPYPEKIAFAGDILYIADSQAGLVILDVTDKANPYELSATPGDGAQGIEISGNFAYVARWNGLMIFDIADPTKPDMLWTAGPYGSRNVTVEGNLAYLSSHDGVRVVDITNPPNPATVGYYRGLAGNPDDIKYNNGYLYMTGWSIGIKIFTVTPQAPTEMDFWQVDLSVSEGAEIKDLQFGVHKYADHGIDYNRGEVELPPKPPANSTLDARFTSIHTGNGLLIDVRENYFEELEWILDIQRVAGGSVTLDWNPLVDYDGFFQLQNMADSVLVDMKVNTSYIITDVNITQLKIVYTLYKMANWNMNYIYGWNLAGLGTIATDNLYTSIFNYNISSAFKYNNGYQQTSILHPGEGYWVNLYGGFAESRRGFAIDSLALDLPAGWSMISGISANYPIGSIDQNPASSITSLWGFDGTEYASETTLVPGKGYWVNMAQAATLTLNEASLAKVSSFRFTIPKITPLSNFPIVFETDKVTKNVTVNITKDGSSEEIEKFFELPPLPPADIFSVRFKEDNSNGHKMIVLKENSQMEKLIKMTVPEGNKSIVVKWESANLESGRFFLKDGFGETLFSDIDMSTQNSLDLSGRNIKLLKFVYDGDIAMVNDYALNQNYPNPFNPSTTISYQIKEKGKVSLMIYNILGQKVRTLVDEVQSNGRYSLKWDGRDNAGKLVAAGVYICHITANNFRQTKKLVLIK